MLCRFTVSLFDGVADISPTQHFWRGTAIVLWEVCISNAYFRIPKKTPHNTLALYNVSFMCLYPTVTATGKENILPINIKAEHFICDLFYKKGFEPELTVSSFPPTLWLCFSQAASVALSLINSSTGWLSSNVSLLARQSIFLFWWMVYSLKCDLWVWDS